LDVLRRLDTMLEIGLSKLVKLAKLGVETLIDAFNATPVVFIRLEIPLKTPCTAADALVLRAVAMLVKLFNPVARFVAVLLTTFARFASPVFAKLAAFVAAVDSELIAVVIPDDTEAVNPLIMFVVVFTMLLIDDVIAPIISVNISGDGAGAACIP